MIKAIKNFFTNTFVLTCLIMVVIALFFWGMSILPTALTILILKTFLIVICTVGMFGAIYGLISAIRR